jgi:WD40 repeat protein
VQESLILCPCQEPTVPFNYVLSLSLSLSSSQVVSALAVDHTGSRVISGSYDYTVRMYDFQGMNSKLQSFRQLEPFEGHQVRSLSWSPTSDKFLCVSGSAQAKLCCLP